MTTTAETIGAQVAGVWAAVAGDLSGGGCRFAGLMGTAQGEALLLSVHLARLGGITTREIVLPAGVRSYPALTPVVAAALWYEREAA